mgnify:CR=1
MEQVSFLGGEALGARAGRCAAGRQERISGGWVVFVVCGRLKTFGTPAHCIYPASSTPHLSLNETPATKRQVEVRVPK